MNVFIKTNYTSYKDILLKEAQGLKILQQALTAENIDIKIVSILSVDEKQLKIQKINRQAPKEELMQKLGKSLALLHRKIFSYYGFTENNYIGISKQKNIISHDWGAFFYQYRLLFQLQLIKEKSIRQKFESILKQNQEKLIGFLNNSCSHASLLHGDLWAGNVLFDKMDVWLIDPAVYYGDREADLAMTEMFGGFTSEFYHSYYQTYPPTAAYEQKKVIYNLYHYLNHYNLFGYSYLPNCQQGFDFIKSLEPF